MKSLKNSSIYKKLALKLSSNSDSTDSTPSADSYESEAFVATKKLAEQGNSAAQFDIGLFYHKGIEVGQDDAKAAEWYLKAANQGHAYAQNNLGHIYAKGLGVQQDIAAAKEWFGRACDNGSQEGCDSYRVLNQQTY